MEIRFYKTEDYLSLVELYKASTEFKYDEVTDSKEALENKTGKDPESVLIAFDGDKILGSVSIIEDGRIALLFRLVARDNDIDTIKLLIAEAEKILASRGYKEVHNTGPVNNETALEIRKASNFNVGNEYTWFWKKLTG